mgnify:CR=1 FL=1
MNKTFIAAIAAVLTLASCSSSDDDGHTGPVSKQIAGHIEKGPFVQGSEVTLTDLNKDLSQSGKTFTTNTSTDLGSFDFGQTLDLSSGLVELKTSGYFYNECSGKLSNSQITLKAIANANESKNLNVNLLTHLEYARVKKLVKDGYSFSKAKEQAEKEILKTFAITDKINTPEKVSLTDNNKDASILLAISSIMLYDKSEAEFSEFIAKFSSDLEKDGTIDDNSTKEKIKDGQEHCHPSEIVKTMEDFYKGKGSNVTISDFSSFVDFNGDGIIDENDREELDLIPDQKTDESSFFNGEKDVQAIVNSMYVKVRDYINLQNALDVIRLNNTGLNQLNSSMSAVQKAWEAGYRCSQTALLITNGLEGKEFSFNTKPYLAQTKALRAIVMYNMAYQWGNIPILTKVSTDGIVNEGLTPSTQAEQLKYALDLLENLDFGNWRGNVYISQAAVNVLKAEIYLTLGKKNEAWSALENVSDEDVFLFSNEMGKKDLEVYSKEYIEYLKEEANGIDNSAKWFANRKNNYGTFAALKRFGKVQSLTGIDSHYNLLPIPLNETYMNPRLPQNPGY